MDNLRLYEQARTVPPEAQKTIKGGRLNGFTDINPMWRIKRLTEMFGPCGVGWWYDITDKRIVEDEVTKQKAAFMDILLFYVDPATGAVSHGIPGTGGSALLAKEKNGFYFSDECFKMALTDAISVAAKALGIGADIYYGKDRDKYTAPEEEEPPRKPERRDSTREELEEEDALCESCGSTILSYFNGGKEVSVAKHITGSLDRYGKKLCINCIRRMQAARAMLEANENR